MKQAYGVHVGLIWAASEVHVGPMWARHASVVHVRHRRDACGMQVAKEELAALLEAQQDVRRAMQSVQSSRRLDEEQQEQQQQHLTDAEARATKLRMLVHGPQAPAVSPPPCAVSCACASRLPFCVAICFAELCCAVL